MALSSMRDNNFAPTIPSAIVTTFVALCLRRLMKKTSFLHVRYPRHFDPRQPIQCSRLLMADNARDFPGASGVP